MSDLNSLSARDWGPPNLMLSAAVRHEVDPLAVSREAGDVVAGRMGSESAGLASHFGDHIDLKLALGI
jgi:hypothetical protein